MIDPTDVTNYERTEEELQELVTAKVFNRLLHKGAIVLKKTDTLVTIIAQEPANDVGSVTMIDIKPAFGFLIADGAPTFLLFNQRLVFMRRQSVFFLNAVSPESLFVFSPILSALFFVFGRLAFGPAFLAHNLSSIFSAIAKISSIAIEVVNRKLSITVFADFCFHVIPHNRSLFSILRKRGELLCD